MEGNTEGVHLEMYPETHAAQWNALECLHSARYHVTFFSFHCKLNHTSVFTNSLVIYFGVGMQRITRKQKQA